MDRQRQVDERNERNVKLIDELRADMRNCDQNPRRGRDEFTHSDCDHQHANQGNENVVDDVDMDDSYEEDYDDSYNYSGQNTLEQKMVKDREAFTRFLER
ncbi:hypothetical protein J1N35_029567 [Gossypium stocksii]|uniref:Uncharacterized protein n=1 Tax=Gossypium stocksii TaxID=47602 RepID=A0A9D3UYI7_9ROSI|nr:hypothetical protein J1N35_029567 [Gossypium stocksii]